jgi:hypothetical protein
MKLVIHFVKIILVLFYLASCNPPSSHVTIVVVSENEPLFADPEIKFEKHDKEGGYYLYSILSKKDSSSNEIALQFGNSRNTEVEFYTVGSRGTYILNLTNREFFCVRHHYGLQLYSPPPYENINKSVISKDGKKTKEIALVKERQIVLLSKDQGLVYGLNQYVPYSVETKEKDPIVYKLYYEEDIKKALKQE